MAYKFYVLSNDAEIRQTHIHITIGFKLIDDTIIDPVAQIVANTYISINIPKNATTQQAKTQIASDTVSILQDFYDDWKQKTTKVVDWLTSNQTILESWVNSHIAF